MLQPHVSLIFPQTLSAIIYIQITLKKNILIVSINRRNNYSKEKLTIALLQTLKTGNLTFTYHVTIFAHTYLPAM